MKNEDIRAMSDEELQRKIDDAKQELFNIRRDLALRKFKNHQRMPAVKKDIARMLTVLRERELVRQYTGEEVAPTGGTVEAAPAEGSRRRGLFGRRQG